MEELVCNFCNKNFATRSVLNKHQKTAKYCLEKQGLKNENYKCQYCSKILATQLRLNTHIDICKSKCKKTKLQKEEEEKDKQLTNYKILVSELKMESLMKDKMIEDLKNQLLNSNNTIAEIAKQPKTISNNNDNRIRTQNNIQQTFDINDVKRISNVLEHHLTPNVLAGGQKGLAEMLKKHLLQNDKGEPIYECTDVARQKFEFVNKHGYVETDPKAAKLITSLNNANIFDVAHSTGKKLWETEEGVDHDAQNVHMPKVTEVLDIKDDSTKFRSHLASITSR